jgi:hypothetical protein
MWPPSGQQRADELALDTSPPVARGARSGRARLLDERLVDLARMMGTSVEQIEKTYGHLLPDAHDRSRAKLEAFDARSTVTREEARWLGGWSDS